MDDKKRKKMVVKKGGSVTVEPEKNSTGKLKPKTEGKQNDK